MEMQFLYFDIETTGLNPKDSEILSVQSQLLDHQKNIDIIEPLLITSNWKHGHEQVIKHFESVIHQTKYPLTGHNLTFEFIFYKQMHPNFDFLDYYYNSFILDLKTPLTFMNNLNFKGRQKFISKSKYGAKIPYLYETKQYWKIEAYIKREANSFSKTFFNLARKLPSI